MMRAVSIGWELEIKLSSEEIDRLANVRLEGGIKVYDIMDKQNLGFRKIKIGIGKIKINVLNAELRAFPKGYVNEVKRFYVVLSERGYEELRERGSTGERMWNNPGCKVLIYNSERLNTKL